MFGVHKATRPERRGNGASRGYPRRGTANFLLFPSIFDPQMAYCAYIYITYILDRHRSVRFDFIGISSRTTSFDECSHRILYGTEEIIHLKILIQNILHNDYGVSGRGTEKICSRRNLSLEIGTQVANGSRNEQRINSSEYEFHYSHVSQEIYIAHIYAISGKGHSWFVSISRALFQ